MAKRYVLLFLKGLLMGMCDIIPGISGGTIAFITGIYERLITAVKSFSPKVVMDLIVWAWKRDSLSLREVKRDLQRMDLVFLAVLFSGIGLSILLTSKLVKFLLENHFAYVIAFFIGLILASSRIIFSNIRNHDLKNVLFGIIGLVFGLGLCFLIPARIDPSPHYLFISGFFAISAMFLPGISGAFILMIMGVYEHLISVLHDIFNNIADVLFFGLGAVLGAFTISRVINFLFSKDRCRTLYVLFGLVIGALAIPVRDVIRTTGSFSLFELVLVSTLLVAGIFSGWGVRSIERKLVEQKSPRTRRKKSERHR